MSSSVIDVPPRFFRFFQVVAALLPLLPLPPAQLLLLLALPVPLPLPLPLARPAQRRIDALNIDGVQGEIIPEANPRTYDI